MKRATTLSVLTILLFLSASLCGRGYGPKRNFHYAVSFDYPVFYRQPYRTYKQVSLYQVSFESNWQSYKYRNRRYSLTFNYGKFFYGKWNENLYGIEYSVLLGRKNHFFELGAGIDSELLSHINLGYRFLLGRNLLIQVRFMPSTWFVNDITDNAEQTTSYLDIEFSIGYQFGPRVTKGITNVKNYISDRLNAQFLFIPYVRYPNEIRFHNSLCFDYIIFRKFEHQIVLNFGTGENLFINYNIGSSYLYNFRNHQFEVGINVVTTHRRVKKYLSLQSQLGYRFHFKKPFFLRIAYVPYLCFEDWKLKVGLHHRMVLGIGYRFGG